MARDLARLTGEVHDFQKEEGAKKEQFLMQAQVLISRMVKQFHKEDGTLSKTIAK